MLYFARGKLYPPHDRSIMEALTLTLPAASLIGGRIPPRELRDELRGRLATAKRAGNKH